MRILRRLALAIFAVAAGNFVSLVFLGRYDFRLGPLHLAATYLFKPLLYLNAAFLLALAFQARSADFGDERVDTSSFKVSLTFWLASAALVVAVYGISFRINLDFHDWTHRALTMHAKPWSFFTHRQYDGFYRPLTFASLWLDNQIFGPALWGYHVQNLILHLLNGYLVARLAFRLGFTQALAQWAGIAFLAVPASFEAVIWPGARFDLLAATFTFLALERALAGSVVATTIAYCLAVLSKETAYAFPLLIGALYLLRKPLRLPLQPARWRLIIFSALAATVALILIRILIYGNLGGYPDVTAPRSVNFVLTPKTFTGIATRLPAAVFLINSGAGLPIWLRIALIAYAALLSWVLFAGGGAGKRTVLLILPVLAVLPMLNMFGWMTQFAQQGRYLYHPAIWIVLILACALRSLRFSSTALTCWVVIMAVAANFNTLAYVKMIRATGVAVAAAAATCKEASCCRKLVLYDLPRDLYGAFYFGYQVSYDLQRALPGVSVISTHDPVPTSPCTVELRWTDQNAWSTPR